jgi:hypothetical protein
MFLNMALVVERLCVGRDEVHLSVLSVIWVPVLGTSLGTSSGCGWKRHPPDMGGSCEYIE